MNSPLFINVLFSPVRDDCITSVSAYGEEIGPVLGQGEREWMKCATTFTAIGGIAEFAPFNSTFVDVRRLRNLTKEQAEAIAKERAIQIVPLPGSDAPSMGG